MEASTVFFLLIVGGFALYAYLLPSIKAASRGHPDVMAIFLLNLLLGWMLVPWVIAIVWAYKVPAMSVSVGDALEHDAGGRRCPFCDEEIRIAAIKCKHCGSDVSAYARASIGEGS